MNFNEFPYWHERDLATEVDRCFLCGCYLNTENKSLEHVFPKWLLDRYGIRKTKVQLLNGSVITYDKLLIPCCKQCNNQHLSKIEVDVSAAFKYGRAGVQTLSKDALFIWVGKIYYGLMYRELTLRSDIRNPGSESIMDPEFLRMFSSHHLLLQHARGLVNWRTGYSPASFLLYDCQESTGNARLNFDYFDVVTLPFLALRIGKVGVICCLQDWGRLENYQDDELLVRAQAAELHPQQFREIAARAAYAISLLGTKVSHIPVYGPSSVTVLDPKLTDYFGEAPKPEDDPASYAALLATALRQPIEDVHDGITTLSLLDDQEGGILRLPWSVDEWKRVHL
ncbi:hypothetical protein [Streptomyces sp. NPDC046925]|uniref:hypothetical protein n=1 Tax=Streptomyces sp. NPDC046925 TaxID=3155375 RepID=UPI0033D0996B